MRKLICFCLMILLLSVTSVAQFPKTNALALNSVSDNSVDEIVYTPFGPAKKSRIHYVDNKHYLNLRNGFIQLVKKENGVITKEFNITPTVADIKNKRSNETVISQNNRSVDLGQNFSEGWITYAVCGLDTRYLTISHFGVNYNVPMPPSKRANQLLYIFNGLQGSDSVVPHIVQPVLQYGVSPAGGGSYWSICNWYVTNNDFFYDSLIFVPPGRMLKSKIELTSSENNQFSYRSSFEGFQTSLQINNLPKLNDICLALEAYYISDCNEYPSDDKIKMTNIRISIDSYMPNLTWSINNPVSSDCGQFTEVIRDSPDNGEIDIHFRTGNSADFFRDIHIYPNPSGNILHIVPEETLLNCDIEIFNISGQLIFFNSYDYLDNDFSLDLGNYADGLFFIRFSYNSRNHLIRKNRHIFKIIKAGNAF